MMLLDKQKSKQKDSWRTPEKRLLIAGLLFGSLGITLGIFPPINHKKRKNKFRIGMPLAFIIHLFLLYQIYIFSTDSMDLFWNIPF
jgi:uncharacterized membrane protein YsdA (DUF1294 family)